MSILNGFAFGMQTFKVGKLNLGPENQKGTEWFPLTAKHIEYLGKFQGLLSRHKSVYTADGVLTKFSKRKLLAITLVNQILKQTGYGDAQKENLNDLKELYILLVKDLKMLDEIQAKHDTRFSGTSVTMSGGSGSRY